MTDTVQTHSIEAEQALLGAILNQNEVLSLVDSIVTEESFFEPIHRQLFAVASQLIGMGRHVNPITIRTFVPADLQIANMTLGQYLARLASEAVSIIHAPDYARLVRDFADRRAIAEVAAALAPKDGAEPSELAQWGIEQLDAIATARAGAGHIAGVGMQEATTRAVDATAKAYQRDGAIIGVPFGLHDLDRKTMGLLPGHVYIVAGRPGSGKTSLVLAAARNQALAGYRPRIESLEMSAVDLTHRMISDHLYEQYRMPYFKMASGDFRETEFTEMVDAAKAIAALPIRLETPLGVTASQICARARIWKRRHGLDVLYIDHIGYVRRPGRDKVSEIGDVMKTFKGLARELDIPVVVLCQLSRGVESREDKRPTLSDLRDSGNIEEDADTVIMVYREAYYLERREPKPGTPDYLAWQKAMEDSYRVMQAIVEKQRQGPIGTVMLYADIACNAIRDKGYQARHKRVAGQEELIGL